MYVIMSMEPSSQLEWPLLTTCPTMRSARLYKAISKTGNASDILRPMIQPESTTTGTTKMATCVAEPSATPMASSILPFIATDTAVTCSTALPTTGRMMIPTNVLVRPPLSVRPSMLDTRNSLKKLTSIVVTPSPKAAAVADRSASSSSSCSSWKRELCVYSWNTSSRMYISMRQAADTRLMKSGTSTSSAVLAPSVGMTMAMLLSSSSDMLATADVELKRRAGYLRAPFSSCTRPPAKKHVPSTSSRLDSTDPSMDACTTRIWLAQSAWMATTTSTALPKVALMSPPMVSPVCSASSSVKSPSMDASGTMERKLSQKTQLEPQSKWYDAQPKGRKIKSTLSGFVMVRWSSVSRSSFVGHTFVFPLCSSSGSSIPALTADPYRRPSLAKSSCVSTSVISTTASKELPPVL
mmetsp:Transcript_17868/g.54681  ORF Transcript_17868/g.54681 Transcript_17868/m.54681 type:complete len:410 (-) Transcript_17868:527-1756(-)